MNIWKSIIVLMTLVGLSRALRTNGNHQQYRLTHRDGEVEVAAPQAGDNLTEHITTTGVSMSVFLASFTHFKDPFSGTPSVSSFVKGYKITIVYLSGLIGCNWPFPLTFGINATRKNKNGIHLLQMKNKTSASQRQVRISCFNFIPWLYTN